MSRQEFETTLQRLQDLPDRFVIHELTCLANELTPLANYVVDAIADRINQARGNARSLVALLYLLDSILKYVGGPYLRLIAKYVVGLFTTAFDQVDELDRQRLEYLLRIWEENRAFPDDLLDVMRRHVLATSQRPSQARVPKRPRPDGRQEEGYQDMLVQEMQHVLNQMFAQLPDQQMMSLAELARVNPSLYEQIRNAAETSLRERLAAAPKPAVAAASKPPQQARPKLPPGHVRGFLGEQAVSVNMTRVRAVFKNLYATGSDPIDAADPKVAQQHRIARAAKAAAMQLGHLISTVDTLPNLPDLSFATDLNQYSAFPATVNDLAPNLLHEAETYTKTIHTKKQERDQQPRIQRKHQPQQSGENATQAVPMKREMPPMRPDDLGRRVPAHVHALYGALEHVSRQDGLRFSSAVRLNEHLDDLAAKARAKKEAEQPYRDWYCSSEQWITDFGRLRNEEEEADFQLEQEEPEELMVKADEHFPKCPISGETFLTIMDDEHGEWVYRNAVRVLLDEGADPSLFRGKAQPLSQDEASPDISKEYRYVIVSRMVFEAWRAQGRIERPSTGDSNAETAWVLTGFKDTAEVKQQG